ncbi:MAG: tRNA (N(6)-L-threonylcarbamoyladenosine(37)-C(2))-methylthiotransferase [Candidatus Aenigmarchaeota archaeon]|nr:tRNA (N(6)-L-threonylcarbamoyladenosine(37)-C(2))-methylthiotransferase [Candidatus Aenigmarchaeota archaeon]
MRRSPKIFMETYGCSANQSESEIMGGLLANAGFRLENAMEDSDFVILNTCFVKTPTEQKIMERIRGISRDFPGKKLVIAGCMPEVRAREIGRAAPLASMVSTHNITRIVDAVKRTAGGERAIFVGKSGEMGLCCPRLRRNSLVGITEISQGCNGKCSYCCVRLAKGTLRCYAPDDIVRDVTGAVKSGCKEIWLTSQDNASYGREGTRLPELIGRVCAIRGDFRTRIGMLGPNNVMPILRGIISAYKNEKVYKFLHLPAQSGSDRVLGRMNREYAAKDIIRIVNEFRKSIPSIALSTDVIVGFPGETDMDFNRTVKLLEQVRPDVVNVSKFGARPGTPAFGMPGLDDRTIKGRSAGISGIVRKISLEKNMEWVGREAEILVTERGRLQGQYIGRNCSYKPVLVTGKENLLGKKLSVKISGAGEAHLSGEPI